MSKKKKIAEVYKPKGSRDNNSNLMSHQEKNKYVNHTFSENFHSEVTRLISAYFLLAKAIPMIILNFKENESIILPCAQKES